MSIGGTRFLVPMACHWMFIIWASVSECFSTAGFFLGSNWLQHRTVEVYLHRLWLSVTSGFGWTLGFECWSQLQKLTELFKERGETLPKELEFQEQDKSTGLGTKKPGSLTDVDEDPVAAERRDKVKEAMFHAWTAYEKYAWGMDELKVSTNYIQKMPFFVIISISMALHNVFAHTGNRFPAYNLLMLSLVLDIDLLLFDPL